MHGAFRPVTDQIHLSVHTHPLPLSLSLRFNIRFFNDVLVLILEILVREGEMMGLWLVGFMKNRTFSLNIAEDRTVSRLLTFAKEAFFQAEKSGTNQLEFSRVFQIGRAHV